MDIGILKRLAAVLSIIAVTSAWCYILVRAPGMALAIMVLFVAILVGYPTICWIIEGKR